MLQTDFIPNTHGFKFSNNDTVWNVPGTPIQGQFLCGGMVYTALDYYNASVEIPQRKTAPPINDALNRYIISRQMAAHVHTIPRLSWGSFWDDAVQWYVDSVSSEFDRIRSSVSRGVPVPLFLVMEQRMHAHHVLVTSCESVPTENGIFLYVYDPNYPDRWTGIQRHGHTKLFALLRPGGGFTALKGFFVDPGYRRHPPPKLPYEPDPPEPLPPYPGPVDPIPPFPIPPPLPSPGSKLYMVQSGDTLSAIAKRHYGSPARWPDIYNANVKVIGPNPNLIRPGQVLSIPA